MRISRHAASSIVALVTSIPTAALANDPTTLPSLTQMSLRAGAALGGVIVLIVALSVLLRRLRESTNAPGNGRRLAALDRIDLGAKREIRLIRADDRLLVIGMTSDRMNLLSELPSPEASDLEASDAPKSLAFSGPRLRKVASSS